MTIALHDLAGADDRVRFSPYCWRAALALQHKGLDAETLLWRFSDKQSIAFTGQGLVPVLTGGTKDVCDSWVIALDDRDKAYFSTSREARFGKPLEQIAVPPEEGVRVLLNVLAPLRATLIRQQYLGGDRPLFGNYMVFAHFQCACTVSSLPLLEPDDPVWTWHKRLLDTFDGFARHAHMAPR
jgi:glutathione S-transferase